MNYRALSRDETASVVEGRGAASRVPVLLHFWVHPQEFGNREPQVRAILNRYPEDAQIIGIRIPDVYHAPDEDPEYRWVNFNDPYEGTTVGLDARPAIADWAQLDSVLRDFPNPHFPGMFPNRPPPDGRYRIGHWWFWLYERHWQLRGMTNALLDYYTDPASVHRLFRAVTDFYLVTIERARRELNVDAILTSDDLGTQTATFFSPEIFAEFYEPYYRELIDRTHDLGMHFWLHACGCIEKFLPRLVDLGLDVIHPIQKYTMDERKIAADFGSRLCVWSGFDVQQVIPWGTPADVRREVRHLMDTYHRPEGRFMFTAGNGVNGDCPVASLEALFDEAFTYGATIARARA
jgi:uroporphyrinogen decarboxylase